MTSVLFVCLGNICRSPMAEGAFAHLLQNTVLTDKIICDSAGNGSWHEGNPPDPRAIAVAHRNGIDLSKQRSRPLRPVDFKTFDLILCMDESNMKRALEICPDDAHATVDLFLTYALGQHDEVPDPYYGSADGFDRVFTQIMTASQALLEKLT